ncbi:MAG: 2-C-methyl-D-erythritol 4-phosphate cytidylyltransferase [Lachnospiraceae bacterium]|nr:2-C-methyl-D-erythritol 4-phosphate cytidylyltransferase [Lachnospiraceae bacterium]
MQTPQAFRGPVIRGAYAAMLGEMAGSTGEGKPESSGDASLCGEAVFTPAGTGAAGDTGAARAMTDDAMVVEVYGNCRVRLVEGSYDNIKITTPEDIPVAEAILARRSEAGQQP